MKQLLSLLSMITITSSTVPTLLLPNKNSLTHQTQLSSEKIDINSVITITNLGIFFTGEVIPSVAEIKKVIKYNNPNVDINAIFIFDISSTSAMVVGNNIKYMGQLQVIYVVLF